MSARGLHCASCNQLIERDERTIQFRRKVRRPGRTRSGTGTMSGIAVWVTSHETCPRDAAEALELAMKQIGFRVIGALRRAGRITHDEALTLLDLA